MNPKRLPRRLRLLLLASLLIFGLLGCTVRVQVGTHVWVIDFGPSPTLQPTFTTQPTLTPPATYTANPTPRPTYTRAPSQTYTIPTLTRTVRFTATRTATRKP